VETGVYRLTDRKINPTHFLSFGSCGRFAPIRARGVVALGDLVDAFGDWVSDDTMRRKIMVDTPAAFYR